ncbi:MAG TPA: EAL domain-containing protein [Oscillospiraceae bacterium]|nr:EAL domain-containing protein [Oscillospiraceae bacterium]HPF55272.1 EAL domain-containing protein [Clostridiales bacterium]HPK36003.1 EAL domain-containing protein [Oscillospiraceae bacterium]HPR76648.1 EAL domain-containing protein [Oscillospiraceae bacterium]
MDILIFHHIEPRSPSSAGSFKLKKKRIYIIATVILIIFGSLYLGYSWNKYHKSAAAEAITLANSLESLLHPEHIAALTGSSADLEKSEYITTKSSLMRLVKTKSQIYFAYLMYERNGDLLFLMDSESPDSPDYSPPGQIFNEYDEADLKPFETGETVLTDPVTDRWGTWISALVPVKDAAGNVIAVFGLDYSAADWNLQIWQQIIPDILIVISIFMLVFALLNTRSQSLRLKELSDKLALDEALYRGVFDQAPIGIAIVNDKSFVTQSEFGNSNINSMFERILGRKSGELIHIKWPEITYPDDLKNDLENFERFKAGEINGYSIEKRFIKPDGSIVWTHMKISNLLGNENSHSSHLCLLEDITNRKLTEKSLKESERSKSVFLSNLPGMAYRCNYDREWTMQFISDGCFTLTGYHIENLLYNRDLSFNDLIAPEYREIIWEEWKRTLALEIPFHFEYEIITADGKRKWVLEHGQGVYNELGELDALEGMILDISASKEIENIFKFNSEHDLWTGLYNRRYLENLLKEDAANRSSEKRAVVSINLSAVHSLSLKYGFQYSQELIKKAAKALDTLSTEHCQLFSTYENRFAFYIKAYKDNKTLSSFCETIVNVLKAVFTTDRIGGGVGIVEIDEENKHDIDLILKNLLIASERAINVFEPDIGVCFFDKEMAAQLSREETINYELSQIAAGVKDERLFLQYQPLLNLETNQICGFEALARFHSDALGSIPPGEFIPIAEKSNLVIPLGYKIMYKAFSFLNRLQQQGYDTVIVSVNISAIQLMKNDFTRNLFDIIAETHANPKNIGIEITESVFVANHDDINQIIGEMKSFGISVAIDDFGKGYSSLSRERELNVNCLKIDKCFIDKIMSPEDQESITGDIISMAHRLGHRVIAEGVENEHQLHYLKAHRCDEAQGYLIGKPLDEEIALEFLQKNNDFDCISNSSRHNSSKFEYSEITPAIYMDQLQLILNSTDQAIFGVDITGNCTFCSNSCIELLGYKARKDLLGKNMHETVHHSRADGTPISVSDCAMDQSIKQGRSFRTESEVFWRADGTFFEVEYHSYPQIKNGDIIGAIIAFADISDRKRKEAESDYLNCHDMLTGLYNRRYFENNRAEIDLPASLPLSVIYSDINGLKMTNDIFGHTAGDALIKKSAEILLQSCRGQDVIARVGGDEFLLLLPNTSSKNAEKILSRIKTGFSNAHVEAIKCSISLGCDTKTNENQSLEMIITNAESAMYKEKAINRNNVNKDMIDTIIKTLYTNNPREHRHSTGVSELCGEIGAALHLPETEISKLKRVGYLHDIGKIILSKDILAKDTLTKEEKEKVQQHPVIGYRILNLFDDTLDLAEFVYGHHEKWDGTGYPRGLKGEQIPLISRIISIAEHYERKLNQGKTSLQKRKQAAVEIIKKGSGIQFDPEIAELFISLKSN